MNIFYSISAYFASLCLLFFACQAQLRHSHRIRHDPFLTYLNHKYKNLKDEEVLRILEKEKSLALNQHDKAIALTRSLLWDQAETLWKANLKESPKFLANYLSLSRLYFLLGNRKPLEQLHSRLAQNKKIPKARLYGLAQKLYAQARVSESLLLMKKLENNPSCPLARSCYLPASLWLADHYFTEASYKKVYVYYMRVLKEKSRHPQALWGLAKLAYFSKQWDKAIAYLELFQKQKKTPLTTRRRSYYLLASSYFQKGKTAKALLQIKKIPKTKHDYKSLGLYGDILLTQNFRANLRGLLKLANSEKTRHSLLRRWYGTEKIEGLEKMNSSFAL